MSKFSALEASVDQAFKVELVDPVSDLPILDKDNNPAFVEVLSTDSDVGRGFDKTRRKLMMARAMRGRNQLAAADDQLEENQAKLAKLTKSWHLVDPHTKDVIDVPCSEDNAAELYSEGATAWIFRQVWLGASETANFIRPSSKS